MAKKRFFFGTLAMVLALSFGLVLAGCGDAESGPSGGGGGGAPTVTKVEQVVQSGTGILLNAFKVVIDERLVFTPTNFYDGTDHGFVIEKEGVGQFVITKVTKDTLSFEGFTLSNSEGGEVVDYRGGTLTYTPNAALVIKKDGGDALAAFTKTIE